MKAMSILVVVQLKQVNNNEADHHQIIHNYKNNENFSMEVARNKRLIIPESKYS